MMLYTLLDVFLRWLDINISMRWRIKVWLYRRVGQPMPKWAFERYAIPLDHSLYRRVTIHVARAQPMPPGAKAVYGRKTLSEGN